MIKRVAVRIALVMVLLVVLAAALPVAASAQTYIWGHVWEMSSYPDPWGNEPWGQGVPGVQVLLKKNGVTIRQPTTTNENGDWGFEVSGVPGVYTIVVQMPVALVTPDGRSAFLFDGAVRLGQVDQWGVPVMWTTIPGLVNPEYTFILVGGGQDPAMLGPIDFLYQCSGAAPMVPPARQDGLPCYNPAWFQVYVHGVVKQVGTMNYVGGVGLQLFEEVLAPDSSRTGIFVPAMRLVAGEVPTPVTCVSQVNANTNGTIGHWGMGFSYRPTWYQIVVTGGAVDADGLPYEFAYAEGCSNAAKEASNWPLMTPNNPNGEIIIWVQ